MKKIICTFVFSAAVLFLFNQNVFAAHDEVTRARGGAWSSDGVYTGKPAEAEEIRNKLYKRKPIVIPPPESTDEQGKVDNENGNEDISDTSDTDNEDVKTGD